MILSQIITKLREALDPWTAQQGGRLSVAKDPWHAYELIASGTVNGLLVVLSYAGRTPLDSPRGNPLATARIDVTVGCGMGLSADSAAPMFLPDTGRPALVDLLNDLVATVCAVNIPGSDTSNIFEFRGDGPVELPGGIRMAAYKATFEISHVVLTTPQAV